VDFVHSGTVKDKDGRAGTIVSASAYGLPQAAQVTVALENGQQVLVPAELLVAQPDGSYYLPLCLAELERSGSELYSDQSIIHVMPVIIEEPAIQKRVVETGKVRITKVVHNHEEYLDVPLMQEEVEITRVPMQRVVDGPIPVRHEGDTMIVSLVEEVLVVEKRLLLTEELHIRTQRRETHQPQRVTLRREEACVERIDLAEKSLKEKTYGKDTGGTV